MDRDLNRVIADAISSLPDSATEGVERIGDRAIPLQWVDPEDRSPRAVRVGIDYSDQHIALVALKKSGAGWRIQALRSEEIESGVSVQSLAGILREFLPAGRVHAHLSIMSSRAIVRRFAIPRVSKSRRVAAASWEARKLVPFPLSERDAFFGFRFTQERGDGWNVTLGGVPRQDAAAILDALRLVGWQLDSFSLSGTQCVSGLAGDTMAGPSGPVGRVWWSRERTTFTVHDQDRILFHYDMGSIAGIPVIQAREMTPDQVRTWLAALEKSVGEAVEFFLSSHSVSPLSRLELCGVDESVAPLVTGWSDRFEIPVTVLDIARTPRCETPAGAGEHMRLHDGAFTNALLAALGTPCIDLRPTGFVRDARSRLYNRIGLLVFASSLAVMTTVSAYTVAHNRLVDRDINMLNSRREALAESEAIARLQLAVDDLRTLDLLHRALDEESPAWSAFVKGLLLTFPQEARLIRMSLSVASPAVPQGGLPLVRMEGRLLPSTANHELTFAAWIGDMEEIAGRGSVKIASVRDIEWKGNRSSLFVIEITPVHTRNEGTLQ